MVKHTEPWERPDRPAFLLSHFDGNRVMAAVLKLYETAAYVLKTPAPEELNGARNTVFGVAKTRLNC